MSKTEATAKRMAKVMCPRSNRPEWGNLSDKNKDSIAKWRCCKCGELHALEVR